MSFLVFAVEPCGKELELCLRTGRFYDSRENSYRTNIIFVDK